MGADLKGFVPSQVVIELAHHKLISACRRPEGRLKYSDAPLAEKCLQISANPGNLIGCVALLTEYQVSDTTVVLVVPAHTQIA